MARILIVDDHQDLREALAAVVGADGHETIEAGDGEEALAMAIQSRPDAVLMDGHMRGVNGLEALRRFKSTPDTMNVPVIMVTALSDLAARSAAMELGANGYVTKPWGDGELEWRIRQVLTSSASAGSRQCTGAPLL